MIQKPHIVRVVADEARKLFFGRNRDLNAIPRPRVSGDEIGVEFDSGEFIPYADLGYSSDIGFFRISETTGITNEAAPYAASGRLIDLGQILISTGASRRLNNDEIRDLLERHAEGDYGDYGEFYEVEVDDSALEGDRVWPPDRGLANKVNTLSGLDAIVSAYTVNGNRYWVITEAGDNRTTMLLFAGSARG